MYLTRFSIENIRAIQWMEWEVPLQRAPGWHVILGDNGSGKSSVLRSIALALIGPDEALALRLDWSSWLCGPELGVVQLFLAPDPKLDRIGSAKGVKLPQRVEATVGLPPGLGGSRTYPQEPSKKGKLPAEHHVWGDGTGWFSAAYGPFRRFTGGNEKYEKLFSSNPRLARHLSVFDESVALTEGLRWLQQLQFKKLEGDPEGALLDPLMEFINQPGFLPHHARLEKITSREVLFVDGNGSRVAVEELSDGYRSILSMTFELIRQLAATYGPKRVFHPKDPTKVDVPGVVLVDEVDAHLHPTWQRRVGLWFREHFPKMQFIVTTHSPLVCQAAEVGTVWRLPRPGTDEEARQVTGVELDRLIFGNVLDAYGTGLFGEGVSHSETSKRRLQRQGSAQAARGGPTAGSTHQATTQRNSRAHRSSP